METIDDETSDAAVDYIKRQATAGKPFFCWYNSTRMHVRTHVAADRRSPPGLTARTEYADGMVEHDGHVGKLLKALDDLDIADNTIVLYTTDNGPHMNTWPDGAMTPFRSEKNTNWEGAFRVPCMIRWPGKIKPGAVSNEIVSGHDWLPTFLAAAGEPDIKEKLLKGYEAAGKTFKVHLDGYNQLPYLTGQVEKSPRRGFFYFNDDGDLVALRYENWKIVFMEQRAPGTLRVWAEPFTPLRLPKLFDLRADPYERADITSNTYYDWFISQPYLFFAGQAGTEMFLEDVQGIPAPAAGGQLHHRPGDEKMKGITGQVGGVRPVRSARGGHRMKSSAAIGAMMAWCSGAVIAPAERPRTTRCRPGPMGGRSGDRPVRRRREEGGRPGFGPRRGSDRRRSTTTARSGRSSPITTRWRSRSTGSRPSPPSTPSGRKSRHSGRPRGRHQGGDGERPAHRLELIAATHAGMTTEEFEPDRADWAAAARHPRFKRPYTELVYRPMLELLDYLRSAGFRTFIVSGGGVEFMRPWAERAYGVRPEQIVGSTIRMKYELRNGRPSLVRLAEIEFIDDGAGKPVGIERHIGRRPILAFGNSDGD